jgi:hypothetical protein
MRDYKRQQKSEVEPQRMEHAKQRLIRMGCSLSSGPDASSFHIFAPDGRQFNFWPFTGWWAGAKQGRGLQSLVDEITPTAAYLASFTPPQEKPHDQPNQARGRGRKG